MYIDEATIDMSNKGLRKGVEERVSIRFFIFCIAMALWEDGTTADRPVHNGVAWATTIIFGTARGLVMYGYDYTYALSTHHSTSSIIFWAQTLGDQGLDWMVYHSSWRLSEEGRALPLPVVRFSPCLFLL